jgi:hypothetical protein
VLPAAPLPALDLSGLSRPAAPLPRPVLDVVVEGFDRVGAYGRGRLESVDDDADRPGTFTCVTDRGEQRYPLRKARDAWPLAVERGLVPAACGSSA